MIVAWESIDVTTENPYQVLVGAGTSGLLPQFLDGVDQLAVIHPAGWGERARQICAQVEQPITWLEVPDAESAKTPQVLFDCWTALAQASFTRSDAILGLGGGATTDLAGFVAATWLRGVKYIAMPTSLLGMVDAAVGGKTGINLDAGKNLVGSFHEPFTVLADLDFLATLPLTELVSGLAEVLKCGFIADPVILDRFEANPTAALTPGSALQAELIRRAIQVKACVVSADLRERTSSLDNIGREALNYGHTLGHAIERSQGYEWRHGQAVAIGMMFVAHLAYSRGLIDADLLQRHRSVLQTAGLPTRFPAGVWFDLRGTMSLDKKSRGATLRFVVLQGLGRPRILQAPSEGELADAYLAMNAT